jgi:hypothetical protein
MCGTLPSRGLTNIVDQRLTQPDRSRLLAKLIRTNRGIGYTLISSHDGNACSEERDDLSIRGH